MITAIHFYCYNINHYLSKKNKLIIIISIIIIIIDYVKKISRMNAPDFNGLVVT